MEKAQDQIRDVTTESEAFSVFHALCDKFQWSGTVFSISDLRQFVANCREADDLPELPDEKLEAWAQELARSWEWRKGLVDALTETGWELIGAAHEDLIHEFTEGRWVPSA